MMFKRRAVAFIDSFRIRKEYKPFQTAQEKFDKEVEEWNLEVETLEREVQVLEESLMEESYLFSDADRQRRVRKIQQQRQDFQRRSSEIFGPDGKAEKRNQELTRPLLDEINDALTLIAANEGLELILDTISGTVAYGSKDVDLTDKVLEVLNSGK